MSGELLCERCGRDYVIWFAPSDVWNTVCRDGNRANPEHWAFLCPNCFTFLAAVIYGLGPWEVRPERFEQEQKTCD